MPDKKPLFHLQNVYVTVNKTEILQDINLAINAHDCVFILGNNGSGKSTLMEVLLENIPYRGKVIRQFPSKDKIGILSDVTPFSPLLKVKEVVKLFVILYKVEASQVAKVIADLNLKAILEKRIAKLSTGEKRRVGLFTALFHQPELLLLDEPLSGIDPNSIHQIHQLIFRPERTTILASHDWDAARKHATKIVFLYQGKPLLKDIVSPEELLSNNFIPFENKIIIREKDIDGEINLEKLAEVQLNYDQTINLFGTNSDLEMQLDKYHIPYSKAKKNLNDVYYYLITKNEL